MQRAAALSLIACALLSGCGSMPKLPEVSLPRLPGSAPRPQPARLAGPPQTVEAPAPTVVAPPPRTEPARPGARQDIFPDRAPAPLAGMDWYFSAGEQEALLIYGASRTSDLRFGLRCSRDRETIDVTQVVDRTRSDSVVFYTLRRMFVYPASVTDDPGGRLLTVELGRGDEGLEAFRTGGWLSVDGPGGSIVGHAPQAGNTAVADFFAWCR